MKMEKTVYTVEELLEYLKNLPKNAELEINGHLGIDVFYVDGENTVCLDNPAF
jgi:hypothetical protein